MGVQTEINSAVIAIHCISKGTIMNNLYIYIYMLLIIVMHDSKFFSEVSFSSYLHFHPQSGKLFEVLECFPLTLLEFYQLLSEFSTAPHGVWLINHNESNEKQNPQFCLV